MSECVWRQITITGLDLYT